MGSGGWDGAEKCPLECLGCPLCQDSFYRGKRSQALQLVSQKPLEVGAKDHLLAHTFLSRWGDSHSLLLLLFRKRNHPNLLPGALGRAGEPGQSLLGCRLYPDCWPLTPLASFSAHPRHLTSSLTVGLGSRKF